MYNLATKLDIFLDICKKYAEKQVDNTINHSIYENHKSIYIFGLCSNKIIYNTKKIK